MKGGFLIYLIQNNKIEIEVGLDGAADNNRGQRPHKPEFGSGTSRNTQIQSIRECGCGYGHTVN